MRYLSAYFIYFEISNPSDSYRIRNTVFFVFFKESYVRLVLKVSAFADYGRKSVPGLKTEIGRFLAGRCPEDKLVKARVVKFEMYLAGCLFDDGNLAALYTLYKQRVNVKIAVAKLPFLADEPLADNEIVAVSRLFVAVTNVAVLVFFKNQLVVFYAVLKKKAGVSADAEGHFLFVLVDYGEGGSEAVLADFVGDSEGKLKGIVFKRLLAFTKLKNSLAVGGFYKRKLVLSYKTVTCGNVTFLAAD